MEFRKLIKEICEEEGINYNLISKDWVMVLSKNNKIRCISGYRFSFNDHALGSIIDDKYAFYDLCKLKNLPIIEHKILFNPYSKLGKNCNELVNKYFNLYDKNVVIKPNMGTEGDNVYHITDENNLKDFVNKLFENNFSISICPFYNIKNEYRVVVLNNNVELIFEKSKPVVIGDGVKSIKELLIELNPYYFNNILFDKKYDLILKSGEVYEYDWRFNLSKGATAKLVLDKELYEKLSKFAIQVCNSINAKFVSVDIINSNNNFYLMEVNSGVCINKVCNFIDKDLKIAKNIYKKAIISMFEE